ncbi:hypothetical protein [Coleofasciculus chthonoplastes]|uniref:hypothetical protein n=1 Tax=Coleofasciculus chthonoplastes TaxID=64178 RepID=UPI0032F51F75
MIALIYSFQINSASPTIAIASHEWTQERRDPAIPNRHPFHLTESGRARVTSG